jgi:VWFA-related protein
MTLRQRRLRAPAVAAVSILFAAPVPAFYGQTPSGQSVLPGGTASSPKGTAAAAEHSSLAGAGSPAVKLYVLAEGRGRHLVLDLKADDFQVWDDGQLQHLTYFAPRSTEPLSLGILLETSRSRLYEPEPVAWQAYSNLLRKLLRPGDQAFVATFAERAAILTAFTEDFTKLDAGLRDAFSAKPQGTASLNDSVYDLCQEPFAGIRGRKALLVIADSADESSFHSKVQTLDEVQRTGVAVYFLLPWIVRALQPPYGAAQDAQLLANSTGGLSFIAFGGQALLDDLDGIAAGLAYTYTLGYTPSNGAGDGRFHAVKVKCARRGVKIDASEGYYAPGK